jgi:hypothetical protein
MSADDACTGARRGQSFNGRRNHWRKLHPCLAAGARHLPPGKFRARFENGSTRTRKDCHNEPAKRLQCFEVTMPDGQRASPVPDWFQSLLYTLKRWWKTSVIGEFRDPQQAGKRKNPPAIRWVFELIYIRLAKYYSE